MSFTKDLRGRPWRRAALSLSVSGTVCLAVAGAPFGTTTTSPALASIVVEGATGGPKLPPQAPFAKIPLSDPPLVGSSGRRPRGARLVLPRPRPEAGARTAPAIVTKASGKVFEAGTLTGPEALLGSASPDELPRVAFVEVPQAEGRASQLPDTAAATPGTVAKLRVDDPATFQTASAKATGTSLLAAYASYAAAEGVLVGAPAAAIFTARGTRVHGLSNNGLDHWWSDRPLPGDMATEKQLTCLAEAVYFEARSESVRGQAAVAQVIVNRVKNPAFPDSTCGVVYQGQKKRNACQFSFACDGKADAIAEPDAWTRAMRVARAYAGGDMWIPAIGAATHYHADYVQTGWARKMKEVAKLGRHVFYIARNGGWS